MNELVSIIIVNYNGKKWLKECFNSIRSQTYKNFEVVLVDNNSCDNSVNFIQENYPEIKIVKNKENHGFGVANNIGVENCNGGSLFFLNNDTILEYNTLDKIVEYKKDNNLNIVGPRILNFEKKDIYAGRKLSIDCTGYLGWGKETFYIEGCALMISKDDFLRLGGFDRKYFMYSEDIDLCWRANLRGMKIGICNNVSIIHFGGGSSETTQLNRDKRHVVPFFRRYEVEKNNLRSLLKNYSLFSIVWTMPLFLVQIFLEIMVYLLTGNWKVIKYLVSSIWWNMVNFKDTLKERKKNQPQRIIKDKIIFKKMSLGINKPRAFFIIGLPKFK